MRWKVHGRRTMYESDWVNVYLDDVELPDGAHIDHHVLTMPKASQTAIVLNESRSRILLIWRHRFITDKWGWEVPAGWAEAGEQASDSIGREVLEETGHLFTDASRLLEYDAVPGISSMHFTVWTGMSGGESQKPDGLETRTVEWHNLIDVPKLIRSRLLNDGPSLTAITAFLTLAADRNSAPNDTSSG